MGLRLKEDGGTPLSYRLIAYYRQVAATHANDPIIGLCLLCKESRCGDWRSATERLLYSEIRTATRIGMPATAEGGPR